MFEAEKVGNKGQRKRGRKKEEESGRRTAEKGFTENQGKDEDVKEVRASE